MATSLLGYTDGSLLDSIVEAFAAGDGAGAFEVVDRVIESGNDPRRFVADLLERLRDLLILAAVPDAAEKGLIDAPADVVERMRAQASSFGAAELSRAADLVNEGLTEMRGATSPRLQLELICARVLLPAAYGDERSVMARLDRLERGAGAFVGAPAMGYVPGPDAHGSSGAGAPMPPGGAAAARAAVRTSAGNGPQSPPGTVPGAPAAGAPAAAPVAPAPAAVGPGAAPAGGDQRQTPPPPPPTAGPTTPADAGPAAPPATASAAPGAWPTAASPGSGRRPGGWPTAAAPGAGLGAPAASSAPAPSGPPATSPGPGSVTGGLDPRQLWPDILEEVKQRRKVTWIMLDQYAHVAGFDGTTLQLGFPGPGPRDSFVNNGSEDVLRQALAERFHVQWKIEAIVTPAGGGSAPHATGGGPGPRPASGSYAGGGGFSGSGGHGGGAPAQPAPAAPAAPPQPPAPPAATSAPAEAPAARPAAPEPPPPVAPEDDIPEDDDPDLDESALSGQELIVRELGATVVEEYTTE